MYPAAIVMAAKVTENERRDNRELAKTTFHALRRI
jgi:hypothetical protein